jgi:hypothetical protein
MVAPPAPVGRRLGCPGPGIAALAGAMAHDQNLSRSAAPNKGHYIRSPAACQWRSQNSRSPGVGKGQALCAFTLRSSGRRRLAEHLAHSEVIWHSARRAEPGGRVPWGTPEVGYVARLNAAAMSSAIIRRLLFSMKKLGPAWR